VARPIAPKGVAHCACKGCVPWRAIGSQRPVPQHLIGDIRRQRSTFVVVKRPKNDARATTLGSVLQVIPRNANKDHVSSRVDAVRHEWSPSHIIPDRWSTASPVGSLGQSRQSAPVTLGSRHVDVFGRIP